MGLDFYAPVGTPVYACVEGVISKHEYRNNTSGFSTYVSGRKKYKGNSVYLINIHLMEFEKTRFRFFKYIKDSVVKDEGWLNYADYATLKSYTDPKKGETYMIHYDSGILKIDQNEIDVELALDISMGLDVKKGQIIGYTGSTGNSYQGKDNNHLHFGLSFNGKPQHPYSTLKKYINLDPSGIETSKKQNGETPSNKW